MSSQTFVGVILLWGACALSARGDQSVSLAWDASPDTNVIGYYIYYKDTLANDLTVLDVGNETTVSVPGLTEGRTYSFVVTAYDRDRLESDPSAEVTYLVPGTIQIRPRTGFFPIGRIKFLVTPGRLYLLQASEDLISWNTIWFAYGFADEWIEYQDPAAARFQQRFYRAVLY